MSLRCGTLCTEVSAPCWCQLSVFRTHFMLQSSRFKLSGAVFLIYVCYKVMEFLPLTSSLTPSPPTAIRQQGRERNRVPPRHPCTPWPFPPSHRFIHLTGAAAPFLGHSRPRKCVCSGREKGRGGKEGFTKLQVCLPTSLPSLPGSSEVPSRPMPTLQPWARTLALHRGGSLRNS